MFRRRPLAVVALLGLGVGIGYLSAQDRGAACTGSRSRVGTGDPVTGLPVDGHRGPSFRSTGYYEDVYVKTAEGWRFKSRTLNWDEAR